ncbi:hypothetical protein B9479_003781 [Cryptococcus floricola]|uniref:ATP-dependent DNA helicase n=1 Tax=Cryptococcus floricola TaxID=2591691 RepID=A0A5D3AZ15_9TREE|nr:hypothetical protein B9479_003781 [Cryptococcus floricola]
MCAPTGTKRPRQSTLEGFAKKRPNITDHAVLQGGQLDVLRAVIDNKQNVFFSGKAGTGKSLTLRQIIISLRSIYKKDNEIAITAPTGLAAINIGGDTIHTWGGIGYGLGTAEELMKGLNGIQRKRWRGCKVLILDEISMVDARLLDKLGEMAKALRKSDVLWGGIQLVFSGDFFQLPPVPRDRSDKPPFAFSSETWKLIDQQIELKTVYRQRDLGLKKILDDVRYANLSKATINLLTMIDRPPKTAPSASSTEPALAPVLTSTREEADRENTSRLNKLPGKVMVYDAVDTINRPWDASIFRGVLAPKRLVVKTGAQVMLVKKIGDDLVNGTMGRILGFDYPQTFRAVAGQWVRDEEDGSIEDEKERKKEANSRRMKKEKLDTEGEAQRYPVVRIVYGAKEGTVDVLVKPDRIEMEDTKGGLKGVPLMLSWAMSIHKAQGMTLHSVIVDVSRCFAPGHVYVALSRATSILRLQVKGFNKDKVKVDPRVMAWARTWMDIPPQV